MAPLVALVFWIGFFPNPLLLKMHASVNDLVEHVDVGDLESAQAEGRKPAFDVRRSMMQVRTSNPAARSENLEPRTSNLLSRAGVR